MKQPDVPLWRKSMLQHLDLDDILKTLYEIAENGDPFGYESSESGYYQDYKEQFDSFGFLSFFCVCFFGKGTVYMLKTTGPDDACIFLQDNRCTIQQAKPTACRLYPFVAEPTPDGGCKFLLSMERSHHFKGGQVQAGRWMKKYFSPEDREFMRIDMGSAPVIALLMRKVPASEQKRAIMQYLWYRFSDFDLDRPLVEQYRQNTIKLVAALKEMQEVST